MSDLQDGETAEIQGSARLPYIIKNVAGESIPSLRPKCP